MSMLTDSGRAITPFTVAAPTTYSARMLRPVALAIALVASFAVPSHAVISLTAESGNQPILFGSGMVLQRGGVVPIWGTADTNVAVKADFVDPSAAPALQILQSITTTANDLGRWVVRFTNLPVGGPYELRLYENNSASASLTLVDVLVGDV